MRWSRRPAEAGWTADAVVPSRLPGATGNQEFFGLFRARR